MVTVRGSGYTISAFFPSFREGVYRAGAPRVTIGIGADDRHVLDDIEFEIREIFGAPVELPISNRC